MTLEERIERAAGVEDPSGPSPEIVRLVERIARNLVPELQDGTHWLAPMEVTEEMVRAAVESKAYVRDWDSEFPRVLEISYSNMRDAYLKEKEPA